MPPDQHQPAPPPSGTPPPADAPTPFATPPIGTASPTGAPSPAGPGDRGRAAPPDERQGVRKLLAIAGYRRLLASRFAAQWGDGVFSAGVGAAVLFNPERAEDPVAAALGLSILVLPYSLLGPFAGALLDRWDRRRVLVWANLLRGVFVLATAVVVAAGAPAVAVFVGALLVTGVSRFVNAGLSASLPHLVRTEHLVEANSLAVTIGAGITVLGSACALGVRAVVGGDDAGSGWTTGVAIVGSVLAAVAAAGFARGRLGPDATNEPAEPMRAIARGLLDGGRAAWRRPTVTAGFAALTSHRVAFAISTLLGLLLFRGVFVDQGVFRGGIAGLGQALAAGGVGVLLAALVTPRLVTRLGRPGAVRLALVTACAGQLALGVPMLLPTIIAAAFVLALCGQVVKLCLDAEVQREIADDTRGRVFALYDAVFNLSYVVASIAAALFVPANGLSTGLMVAAAVSYLLGLAAYESLRRRAVVDA